MKTIEIIITVIFVLGGIAIIATVIKYPKDVARNIFIELPKAFFNTVLDKFSIVFLPIWGVIWLLDKCFKWNISDRFKMFHDSDYKYKGAQKRIYFKEYEKYILTTELDKERIENSIKEASETILELDISEYKINKLSSFSVVVLPKVGFYGFNFLTQWLNEELKGFEVFGFARSNKISFFVYQDPKTTNNLIGKTNKGKKFSISMYDDLEKKSFLRMNDDIEVSNKLTTEYFSKLIKTTP